MKKGKSKKLLKLKRLENVGSFRTLVGMIDSNEGLLDSMSKEEYQTAIYFIKNKMRDKCFKDLYFLCKYVIGYKDMTPDFHGPLCKKMEEVNEKYLKRKELPYIRLRDRSRLWMVFRGSFKTSVLNVGHTIQLMLLDPNIRVCMASNTLDNAKAMLKILKNVFMKNPLFRFLFPEYCPKVSPTGKVEWGTNQSVVLPNRTNLTLKEGSIECAGVDTSLTSRHYDYLKKDDLVTPKSVNTYEQIQLTIDWDRLSISLFDEAQKGFTDWLGTRYDERDLYGHLLKREDKDLERTIVPVRDTLGNIVFKERFTEESLEQIQEDQGSYIFNAQYLLKTIPKEGQKFFDHWFKTYESLPNEYGICILVDPAAGNSKAACYTSIVVHAMCKIENKTYWYFVDGVFDKLRPTQRIQKVFDMVKKWKDSLRIVSYETIGFQETDKAFLEKKMEEEQFHFHITQIKQQTTSKERRIEGLVPFYEYGKIFFPKHMYYNSEWSGKRIDLVEILKYELIKFPQSEHLDFADAQAQQLAYSKVTPFIKEEKKEIVVGSFNWFRDKVIKEKKRKKKSSFDILVGNKF